MIMRKFASIGAAAALGLSLVALAPPASAAQTVTADCATVSVNGFYVYSGEQVVFDMSQGTCPTILGNYGITDTTSFQTAVDAVANLMGTGGSAIANFSAMTVTYTAGPGIGTDSLKLPIACPARRSA